MPDISAYSKSKTFAEKAAWDMQREWEKKGEYSPEIVTICPSVVLGDVIAQGADTSSSLVLKIMTNTIAGYVQINFNTVDVKDVSVAHVRAVERPEAKNKRFVLSQEKGESLLSLADNLSDALEEKGYQIQINRKATAYCFMKFFSYFSQDAADVLPHIGKPPKIFDNKRSREILGIEYKRTTK